MPPDAAAATFVPKSPHCWLCVIQMPAALSPRKSAARAGPCANDGGDTTNTAITTNCQRENRLPKDARKTPAGRAALAMGPSSPLKNTSIRSLQHRLTALVCQEHCRRVVSPGPVG